MKEVLSTKVSLEDSLSLNDILSLHQFSKHYNGFVYILVNQKFINPNNLPKLVTYLLTKKCELTIIVEGHNVQETLSKIQQWLNKVQARVKIKTSLEPSI